MDFIKEFWENQAKTYGVKPDASWGDCLALELEHQTRAKYIEEHHYILDVGCANGFALVRHNVLGRGVDFSPQMIKEANNIKTNIATFTTADARSLPFDDNSFDIVYTTRTLINLPNWEDQKTAISEMLRVARKKVLILEAFYEPLQKLNAIRQLCGLPLLVEHDFNRYLKKEKLEEYLNGQNWQCEQFSDVYYLGSRFIRDLVTDITKYEGYTNPINKIFYDIQQSFTGGGFGIQQAYIITL